MHKQKLEEVMERMMLKKKLNNLQSKPKQSHIERRMAQCIKTPLYFDDLGSIH